MYKRVSTYHINSIHTINTTYETNCCTFSSCSLSRTHSLASLANSLSVNALTGDGTQHARMDATTAAGRDPREVADEIWQAAAQGREELVIAEPKVKLAVLLRALAPKLLFGIMAKRALKEEGGAQ